MLLETVSFSLNDLAKYPFPKETTRYLKKLDLTIADLFNPDMSQILKRAQERLENAILSVSVGKELENNVEIPSFPVALLLAIATGNSFIKKRYALAEAKQAFLSMQLETSEKIVAIARDFGWIIESSALSDAPLSLPFFSQTI